MAKIISLKEAKKNKNQYHINKNLVIIVTILFVILIFIFHASKVKAINIEGNIRYSNDEIKQIIGINEKTSLLKHRIMSKQVDLKTHPYIENIDIKYISVNSVLVNVYEKKIISYIPYMGKYLCLDKEGKVIDYVSKKEAGIPIVKGIAFDSFIIGDKLAIDNDRVFSIILDIYHNINKFKINIDYINFNYAVEENIELEVDNIVIKFGKSENYNEKFIYLKQAIALIPKGKRGYLDISDTSKEIYLKDM